MKTYKSPVRKRKLGESAWETPGPPRAYAEWKALSRWNRLPPGEMDVCGYLLRMMREEAGITQKALAEKLGVTQQAVAQAERWTSNPTLSFVRRWCRACGREFNLREAFS